jgi:hypothetical protein
MYLLSFTQALCCQVLEEKNFVQETYIGQERKHDIKNQLHNGRKRRVNRYGCQKLIACYCNKSGHQKASCWKLNPELRPKKEKRIAHVLMKEEILPVKQEEHREEKKPTTWFFQKWMSQLHCILLPLM